MFTEADRVDIRNYLGFGALWLQADPRLESAITTVQSIADGGTRPDNTTELAAKALVTKLKTVDAKLEGLWDEMDATAVDEVHVNPARAVGLLRMEGRRLVHRLARIFDTKPRADVFSGTDSEPEGYPLAAAGGHTAY